MPHGTLRLEAKTVGVVGPPELLELPELELELQLPEPIQAKQPGVSPPPVPVQFHM
jgi:hypothetical protein